jgi:uncharacterized protein
MNTAPLYRFEWDPNKARTNLQKHQVSFALARSVFRDALAITVYDEEHSDDEQRWVTIGQASSGQTLVVIHTFTQLDATTIELRLISARKADRQERKDYEQQMQH